MSICCASRHSESDGVVRLSLNGPLSDPSPQAKARETLNSAIDLHTVAAPIFDESPHATIEDLGLDETGEITLYVVKRNSKHDDATDVLEARGGKAGVYTARDDWVGPLMSGCSTC